MRKWSFVKKVISESRIFENRTEARPKISYNLRAAQNVGPAK